MQMVLKIFIVIVCIAEFIAPYFVSLFFLALSATTITKRKPRENAWEIAANVLILFSSVEIIRNPEELYPVVMLISCTMFLVFQLIFEKKGNTWTIFDKFFLISYALITLLLTVTIILQLFT